MFSFCYRNRIKVLLLFFVLILVSCNNVQAVRNYTEIDAPDEISARAYEFAEIYADSDTVYEWGGQDPVRKVIHIDCSGLIVMCYKYAMVDTPYILLKPDMASNYIYQNATTIINCNELKKGNLILMGEANSNQITHIGIFEKEQNDIIYFIDSTQKDTNGDGINDIDGVTRRQYNKNDERFKAFGRMRVKF